MTNRLRVALLFLLVASLPPLLRAQDSGSISTATCSGITGWAWDTTSDRLNVTLLTAPAAGQNETVLTTLVADQSGAPVGDGYHAFSYSIPPGLINSTNYYIYAVFGSYNPTGSDTYLTNSGSYHINCSPSGPAPYTYYQTSSFTSSVDLTKWTENGGASVLSASSTAGLVNSNGNGGDLLSSVAVPGGATDYEINATLGITGTSSPGAIAIYLRATAGSLLHIGGTSVGTFDAEYISNITCTGTACTGTLTLYQVSSGTVTTASVGSVPLHNNSTFRAMVHGGHLGAVYIDNILYQLFGMTVPSGTTYPGIGVVGSTNGILSASLGSIDTVNPNTVPSTSIQTSLQPNQISLHWEPVLDNQGGIGVAYYDIYKNNVWLQHSLTTNFVDTAVTPGTSYTYWIVPLDYHLNSSITIFTATTPPANAIDGRQIGVRTTGTYWGGGGEQIDMRSGNLNYTQPLIKPMGRGGWSVPFSLSYNSQNWRLNQGGANWLLGEDTGYGFGWKLQAGSLTPVYDNYYTIAQYIFTDSTGAQYVLNTNANNAGVWSSTDSVYVWYDTTASPPRLHFPDGSFWEFGCQSAGTEQDGGTLYPTLMEDSNGNEITATYEPGVGITATNSSARIQTISDVRGSPTYAFSYTADFIPHLYSIANYISTAENYSFTILYGQALDTPYSGQTFYTSTNLLQSVTQNETQLTTSFAYDQYGSAPYATSGSLTQVTFPYGGYLGWSYMNYQFSDETLPYVATRTLAPGGATTYSYTMAWGSDTGLTSHSQATWLDATAGAQKVWTFQTNGSVSPSGVALTFAQETSASVMKSQDTYTWGTDAGGVRPVLTGVVSALDPNQTYGVQKQTTQTVDQYGNLLTQKVYNYGTAGGGVGSLARTYTNVYLNDNNTGTYDPGPIYSSRYIFNRLQSTTVTDGTNTSTLASNVYDNILAPVCLTTVTNMPAHDSAYNGACPAGDGGTNFIYRGNLTNAGTPTSYVTMTYDIGGNVVTSATNGVTTSTNTSTNSSTNYAAPSTLTTNSLSSSLSWSSFLGITSATGPNGDVASVTYDGSARPQKTTSATGAVTNYGYATSGSYTFTGSSFPTNTATTNGHWVNTQLDGFGRTLHAVTGYGTGTGTTVSEVDTVYAPCGCSPMGKVSQVSLPYVTANTQQWTTYAYDALGRTLSVTLPDASKTSYSYSGNTVTVTDAASNSKTFTMDVFGNLISVQETDPTLNTVTTSYTYDVLNHLIGVSMPRGSTTQTRTFNYILPGKYVSGFLQSATNPENGTVTYTYNGNNLIASKTDARNQQITYSYDTYNRLTQVSYFPTSGGSEDISQRLTYIYDTNTLDTKQTFSNYTSGRLAAVTYGPESNLNTNPYSIILPTFAEWYNYTQAGLVATKRLQLQQTATVQWPSTKNVALTPLNFDAAYTYDSGGEGKIASVAYPAGGPTYSYQFDSLYRLSGMTDQNSNTDVSGVAYNPANQLTSITYFGVAESRSYNSLNQLTGVSATEGYTRFINKSYTYPTGTNIGKISSQTDSLSGETVQYTYDSLNRLATAATANTAWGQSYTYDAFGNLTGESVTQGSAPSMTLAGSSATNQFGGGYDLNGNMTTSGATTMTYDVANRMIISATSTGSAHFSYDTRNRRVWQWNGAVDQNNNPVSYSIYYYGANGKRLVAYTVTLSQVLTNGHISGYTLNSSVVLQDTYFGRRRLAPMDRIGSAADVGAYPGQQSISFFPYGQDKGTAGANDNWKFATYWRDSATGLDYAMNRYYSSGLGRFLSADPYTASGGPAVPQSWNRYAYVQGDPINWIDPSGRDVIDPEQCFEAGIWDASIDCGDGDSFGFLGYSSPPPLSQNQIVSIFRSAVAAAATAWLLANESRTSANTSIPTYLKEKSECWFPDSGAGSVQSATYTLFVTYQILNQNGQPIDGSALSGVSITEGIYPLSGALSPGPPWRYGTKYGIQQDGTFTDLLSSGGLPSFPNYITAFQTFTAGGTIAGVSFFQPLLVIGFGPTTGVLQNAYGPNNVTINGMGLGTNPATECPKNQ